MIIESGGRRTASTKRKFRIKGIRADSAVARDLFVVQPTGVSLEPLREAVAAFLASYSDEQREAMSGAFDPVSPFYYRIYSPVIFIEFYHEPGIALPNTGYNRRHGHALVRTPNSNDYEWDLLRQHLAAHPSEN